MSANASANFIAATAFALLAAATPSAVGADASPRTAAAEVQFGLCSDTDHIIHALALRPRGARLEVWQFDDATLSLFDRGLRFRLRVAPTASELTLKAAVKDCADVAAEYVPAGAGKCEYDVYGPNITAAVSLNRRLDKAAADALIAGRLALEDALGASQVRYLREVAVAWPLPAHLRSLGPIVVQKYRVPKKPYEVDVTAMPDGEHYAEISARVAVAAIERTRETLEQDIAHARVVVCADPTGQAKNKLNALLRRP